MKEDETTHRVKRLSFNYALHTMRKFKNSIPEDSRVKARFTVCVPMW